MSDRCTNVFGPFVFDKYHANLVYENNRAPEVYDGGNRIYYVLKYGWKNAEKRVSLTSWTMADFHVKFMDALVQAQKKDLVDRMELDVENYKLTLTFKEPIDADDEQGISTVYFWFYSPRARAARRKDL